MSLMNSLFGVSAKDGILNVALQLRLKVVQPVLDDVRAQVEVPQEFSWLPAVWQANIAGSVAPQENELVNEILTHYDSVLTDEQMAQAFGLAVRDTKLEAIREYSSTNQTKDIARRAHKFSVQARWSWINVRESIQDQTDTREVDQALNGAEYDMLAAIWQSEGRPDGQAWTDIVLAAVWAFSEVRVQEFAKAMLRAASSQSHDGFGQQVQELCSFLDTEQAAIKADVAELDRSMERGLKELQHLGREAEVVHRAAGGLKLRRR